VPKSVPVSTSGCELQFHRPVQGHLGLLHRVDSFILGVFLRLGDGGVTKQLRYLTKGKPVLKPSGARHTHIIGKGPALSRRHAENEAEFVQLAYIECVKAHGLDKVNPHTLNGSDLAMIAATASPELALKHMKGDGLTEGHLSAVAELS